MSHQEIILWSRLIHNSWRQEFRCPDELIVTNEEFAAEFSAAIAENHIPAEVTQYIVNWDDLGKRQNRILVRYTGTDAVTDVLRYMVGVDRVGRFTYIEEKTYFAPPDLPSPPRKKRALPITFIGLWISMFVMGVLCSITGTALILADIFFHWNNIALFSSLGCCIGPGIIVLVLAVWLLHSDGKERAKIPEIESWNRAAEMEVQAREKTWEDWESSILTSIYLSRTDDTLGRFVEAVRSTVSQVTQKLFIDHNAEMLRESKEENTQEEIKKEMQRRHAEIFG